MKNLTQKTSRKPKKTKKNNIPGLLEKEKCKNQKNLEKTKKNKKNNIPELLSVDPISKLLEYWFFCFFWFSRGFFDFCLFSLFQESWNIGFFCFLEVFLIFAFFLFQESWNIVFFGFFGFLEVFWTFAFFLFQESWNIVFFVFFLVFSSLYLIFAFFSFARLMCFFCFLRFFFQGVFSKTSELSFAWFSQGFCILLVTSLSCLRDMRLVTPICLSLAVHKSKKSNASLFF